MEDQKQTRISDGVPDKFVGRTLDGYRIDELIGRGGMGEVYRATQLSLNRPVAIKVLPESLAEDKRFLDRFEREVDILSRLSHPAIVTVFERGEVDGRPYLAMEYVEGTSLRAVLKQGPLPPTDALVIVRAVLGALEHAHKKGIIHRDIKPENILLAPGGVVKVADFGLSRLVHGEELTRLTQSLVALGTYEYMAPEQREQSKDCDERTDLYATGVVLYETIAGELPIGHFDALSKKRPEECDSRIDSVVERSLKKSPEERFHDATAMGDAVSQLISKPGIMPVVAAAVPFAEPVGDSIVESMPAQPVERATPSDQALAQAEAARMEHHLDNLAVIDRVLAVALVLVGIAWFAIAAVEPPKQDAMVLFSALGVLWFFGAALCWRTATLTKERRFGAQGFQAFVASVAGLTVLLLPFTYYSFWVLWGHRGRRYYTARASGKSPIEAALQVVILFGSGMHQQERKVERQRKKSLASVLVIGGIVLVLAAMVTGQSFPLWIGLGFLALIVLLPFVLGILFPLLMAGVVVAAVMFFTVSGDSVREPDVPSAPARVANLYRLHRVVRHIGVPPPDRYLEAILGDPQVREWIRRVANTPKYPTGTLLKANGRNVDLLFSRSIWGAWETNTEQRIVLAVAYALSKRAPEWVETARTVDMSNVLEKHPFPGKEGK
ncbi:MAG: serine/threonine-protein kinase [Planctomycetota bacterium]